MNLYGGSPKGRDTPSIAASGEASRTPELLSWQNSEARAGEPELITLALLVCVYLTLSYVLQSDTALQVWLGSCGPYLIHFL